MTGSAGHPAARNRPASNLGLPQAEMRRAFIGQAVAVIVTGSTGLHSRLSRIKGMRGMAGIAAELLVPRACFHGQARHARAHGGKFLRQAHPMLARGKTLDLLLMALRTSRMIGPVLPLCLLSPRTLGLMTICAVD